MNGLRDYRVIDFSTRIAGHYCSKLLADAGAEVIKIEPAGGDPLRQWSASGADLQGRDSAFFRYLNTGKQSVVGSPADPFVLDLIASADLVIETYAPDAEELAVLQQRDPAGRFPSLVLLSISAYGRSGPWANRAATEFTLQADSGSLCMRGRRYQPPVQAGGKITEYVGGTFAAVAALAAMMRAKKSLQGESIDFSLLEVFNIAGTTQADMMSSLWGRPDVPGLLRNVEVPSIEPTKDGWVGFATMTFQQYSDFLVMIGRTDLLEQKDLATAQGRSKRMQEWNEIVHAWTRERTTQQIIETAALLRIPVAPVNNGKTVLDHEQLLARQVFVENPARHSTEPAFRQPRPPYLIDGRTLFPFRAAPALGEHCKHIPSRQRDAVRPPKPAGGDELPLQGIRILDATAWWAGPSATQMLAHLGAQVIHLEAIQRPDGARMMGGMYSHQKDWHEFSPMFLSTNTNKQGLTLNLEHPRGKDVAGELLKHCDVFVENYSPRVMERFGLDWPTVHALNPRCIMVRMPAFGLDGPWKDHVGFAQTMEQISGMAWLTGHTDDQPRIQRGPCDPMAGMNAALAVLVALNERDRDRTSGGSGCLIESPMVEGAINAAAEAIVEYTAYGNILSRMGNRSPDAAPQGLYACAHHDRKNEQWLALSVETDQQWQQLNIALGNPDWAQDPSLANLSGRQRHHDQLDRHLQAFLQDKPLEAILEQWSRNGIPVAPVRSSVRTWNHPQLLSRHFFEELAHPVAGRHLHVGVPFRFASRDVRAQRWLQTPAPTLGQHNRDVLAGLLRMSEDEIRGLEEVGVIGTALSSERNPRV
jgi:crotonobetainyl-CoA:carnitine CoA-transferase CaiB-like acyl-CoA transferase